MGEARLAGNIGGGRPEMFVILGWAGQICLSYSKGMARSEVIFKGAGQILCKTGLGRTDLS